MRPACACVSGGEGHLFPLWWARAAVTTFACHAWGGPTRGSRPQVGCSPVGLLHHLRVTGSCDEVTLRRGHRGIRPHLRVVSAKGRFLRSRPMSADGLVRSCRRAASRDEGVRAPRGDEWWVSVRFVTGGARGPTGVPMALVPGVMSGRSSLVHRNDVAPTWNAPREFLVLHSRTKQVLHAPSRQ